MRVGHYVLRGLLEDHLLDGKRIKGRGWSRVVRSKWADVPVVVNRRGLKHERRRLRGKGVLQIPLQFHPSVLEPSPHLGENDKLEHIQHHDSSSCWRKLLSVVYGSGRCFYLSFCEVELLCRLHPFSRLQILVLAEDLLQPVDLFRGELGAYSALPPVRLCFASTLIHREALRRRRLAVVSGGVSASVRNCEQISELVRRKKRLEEGEWERGAGGSVGCRLFTIYRVMSRLLVVRSLCGRRAWKFWVLAADNTLRKPAAAAEPCMQHAIDQTAEKQPPAPPPVKCCDGSERASPQKSISPCSQCG